MNRQVLIAVSGVTKRFDTAAETVAVLRHVDLVVCAGDRVAIVGPSGSGKSTLLFILGLLLPPTSGSYALQGRNVLNLDRRMQAEYRRTQFGFVFQSCNLIEHSTVWENLEFPLIYSGVGRGERMDRIRQALDRVGLAHRINHPANLLSGGEQQRVAIARALVNNPRVILADEPTGQLDRDHGQRVLDDFEQATAGGDTALVVVTHDPAVAARCSRVFRMEEGNLTEQKGGE